jgi:hypothetical protein
MRCNNVKIVLPSWMFAQNKSNVHTSEYVDIFIFIDSVTVTARDQMINVIDILRNFGLRIGKCSVIRIRAYGKQGLLLQVLRNI